MSVPRALTIASSDSGGGAGIQADLKAFAAAGCSRHERDRRADGAEHGRASTAIHELPPAFVRAQLDAVFEDIGVDAAKTGMLFSRAIIETVADFLEEHPRPARRRPGHGRELGRDAARGRRGRGARHAPVPARDRRDAEPARGAGADGAGRGGSPSARRAPARARRRRPCSSPAGTASIRSTISSTASCTSRSRSRYADVAATHGAGCTHSATLAALLARGEDLVTAAGIASATASDAVAHGLAEIGAGDGPVDVFHLRGAPMTPSPGDALRDLRERKPLIHQITNYVVMNETANATLAIGALPVMAHARRGGRGDGVLRRRARPQHRHALAAVDRRDAPRGQGPRTPPVRRSSSIRSASARRRCGTETAKRILADVEVAVVRGNRRRGRGACGVAGGDPRRRVDRRRRGGRRARAAGGGRRSASSRPSPARWTTSPTETRTVAVANGDPLLARSRAPAACRARSRAASLAVAPPLEAAAAALAAFGVAGEDAAVDAKGPGTFHANLYDALYNLDTGRAGRTCEDRETREAPLPSSTTPTPPRRPSTVARPSSSCG